MENIIYYNLTYPQKSIWMIEQFYPGSNINCMGGSLKIFEQVRFDLLEKAFNILLKKNDGLRLRFTIKDGKPVQYVTEYCPEKVEVIDVTEEEFVKHIAKLPPETFNIMDKKMYNFKVFRFENGNGAFVAYLHHLICDAWTTALFTNEIMKIYSNLKNNEEVLDEKFPSYIDFINNENNYLMSNRFKNDTEYWEKEFSSSPSILSLKENPEKFSTEFNRKIFKFPATSLQNMRNFAISHEASIPSFFFAIYSLYFSRILDTNKLIVGNPVLNRSSFTEKQIMGMFISTVPATFEYDGDLTFVERMSNIAKKQSSMFRHLKYPYEEILNYVKTKYERSSNLYDIVFSYQNAHSNVKELDIPFEVIWTPSGNQLESLMIHITDTNCTGEITVNYDYQTSVFSESDIINLHERIEEIIEQILVQPNIKCKDIDIISKKEQTLLLKEYNSTKCEFRKTTIIDEFEKCVSLHPKNIAVSFGEEHLTYEVLNNRANILANKLSTLNVGANDIVGILLPRSTDIITSILAILKLGATYMPVEPEYPKDRVKFMLENSKAKLLITTEKLKDIVMTEVPLLIIDEQKSADTQNQSNINVKHVPESLAYIMYTSGTTGTPKAVMIRNYSVINFASAMEKRLDYSASSDNKVLSVTTMCFDIFVFEVFPTLINGLHLVIANEDEQKNPVLLSALIEKEKICKILTTPSRVQLLFLDTKYLNCLKTVKEIVLGGEAFPQNLLEKLPLITDARIFNLYGPTETTVYSTFKNLTNETNITIGKPIDNTTIYILDKNKKLLPPNYVGEIYIGGAGVALGYYHNKTLTDEKFSINPHNDGEIIYNTGDLGKWISNGEIICLGRTDNQIKIRGYRIELGDIESNILKFPGINKVVVADKINNDGNKFLCAYFISDTEIMVNELHKYLLTKLPNYMVPSAYMRLDSFPLTPNHKIDKKSLPMPNVALEFHENYVAPTNEIQKVLCEIVSKALSISKIGINDDIFDYSADSLTVIQIQTMLIPYGWKFKTQDFYTHRTIKDLSLLVEAQINGESINCSKKRLEQDDELLKINDLLHKHDLMKISSNTKNSIGYFITGSTGYLGIHVLYELLQNTNAKIFCAIRSKNGRDPLQRIKDIWEYYFPDFVLNLNRISVIECDIIAQNLGLSNERLQELATQIDTVFNCAANVRYYGEYAEHEKINVTAVKNLIDYCVKYKLHFNHISTLGVSGNYLVSQNKPNTIFTENDFYIGQNYMENVYIHSKFEAEKCIYMAKNLEYTIFRVGNLTARISDGRFQKNIEENAFYNILQFMITDKIVPKDMLGQFLEFTPVDLCAHYLVVLSKLKCSKNKVFHLFNNNTLLLDDLLNHLSTLNIDISALNTENFNEKIVELSKDAESQKTLKAIINDLDTKKGLAFMPSVIQNNNVTNLYLQKIGLVWPKMSWDYIERSLKHMDSRKYISL